MLHRRLAKRSLPPDEIDQPPFPPPSTIGRGIHTDRAAGRYRHYRDLGVATFTGFGQGQEQGHRRLLYG